MPRLSKLISKYLITAIVPYFAAAWLLLSVVLFLQQANRFADIFLGLNVPTNLVWQLTIALIPNVIAFTCPTALLVGTVIGLAKMQGDSELVAIRAAGVGNFQIAIPIVLLGIVLSAFAFVVNQSGVPAAASFVRKVALQSAIQKLESPLEPGAFNSEIAGYTFYVRGGDLETGKWTDLFAYREDSSAGVVRIMTSKAGRIDTTDQNSELVLEDASAVTLPLAPGSGQYVTEKIGDVRFAIKTKRAEMVSKLVSDQALPEELSLSELSAFADSHDGRESLEARILWQRRILLTISPLLFCLLGTAMVLRFNRGGHGFGSALSLAGLTGFYAIGFFAEQLVRTATIPVWGALALPVGASILAVTWLTVAGKMPFAVRISEAVQGTLTRLRSAPSRMQIRNIFVDLTTGLRDFDIARNVLGFFFLTLAFLLVIFLVFTGFDMWKFAGSLPNGPSTLGKYLVFLVPYLYMQVAAPAAMIATLATFVIKSRQNEIVTWTAAGQSVYRLLVPCFLLMTLIGGFNWAVQEYMLPQANVLQDDLRDTLQNKGVPRVSSGRVWIAEGNHIFSFLPAGTTPDPSLAPKADLPSLPFGSGPGTRPITPASDNDNAITLCPTCPSDISVYEFGDQSGVLQSAYRAKYGKWESGSIQLIGDVEVDAIKTGGVQASTENGKQIAAAANPFIALDTRTSHLDTSGLRQQLAKANSDDDQRILRLAVEKRYTTLFLPLVSALLVAPFALSLDRKGKSTMVALAVSVWLIFAITGVIFEKTALNGLLSPTMAAWAPLAIAALIGVYLLSRART